MLQEFPYTDGNLADEQAKRKQAADVRAGETRRRVAGADLPSDAQGKIGAGDLVADSTVNA